MKIIYDENMLNHNLMENFGEGSYRLKETKDDLKRVSLDFDVKKDILLVHTKNHLQKIKGHCKFGIPIAEVKPNKYTLNAIYSSVRLAIYASENNDFAMTRPPGHHASRDTAKGFCFLNNIAIASKRLIDKGKKVCIIDIDGHHGDGTEKIFYKDKNLLLCSIYQERSYPANKGNLTDIGSGEGRGYNLKLPIPVGSGDDIFLESLDFFRPYIEKFNPDIIGISAGFDGYKKDNLLNLNYTLKGYNLFGRKLKEMNYPLFGVLEGGYHSEVISCSRAFVLGINGKTIKEEEISKSDEKIYSKFKKNVNRLEGKLNEISFL